jgi:hypothetical protein
MADMQRRKTITERICYGEIVDKKIKRDILMTWESGEIAASFASVLSWHEGLFGST